MRVLIAAVLSLVSVTGAGCSGYSFQHSQNALLDREGIRRIYVAPIVNNTYKPGVENLLYNEVVRAISTGRRVALVHRREEADAVLTGSVTTAMYSPSVPTTADQLYPQGTGSSNQQVASEYAVNLNANFSLTRIATKLKPERSVWSGGFTRGKSFPGNNQLGVYGETSALINESEFDRALRDLARQMSSDLHETMLAMF